MDVTVIRACCTLFTILSAGISAQDLVLEVRRAEDELATALITKDTGGFERLLAAAFVLRGAPDISRADWIAHATSACWGDSYEISDFSIVRAAGDTVIASLVLATTKDPVSCETATVRSLLTDVWIRQDGRLRLALRHSGAADAGLAQQFSTTPPPPPRWERSAEASLVATGGNTDTQTLGAGGAVIWRPGPWETKARAAFVRSATGVTTTAESFVAELRQSRTLTPRAQAFGRADYLINRFAGIDYRLKLDAGMSWTVTDTERMTLRGDAGLGVTHESRLAGTDQTFGAGTLGVFSKWRPLRTTQIEERAVFSTDLGAFGNWRLQNTVTLSVTMTRLLSLKLSHDLEYVARPVAGFEPSDTIVAAALVLRF